MDHFSTFFFLPHHRQGLTFADGTMFESTGLRGQSSVRTVDPETGNVSSVYNLPDQYFGEGMAFYKGELFQLTWTSATGFVYNPATLTLSPPRSFQYETTKNNEGWGITVYEEKDEFIVTDGSNNLIFWDTNSFEILRTVPVYRQDGRAAVRLNELEFWRGRVLANVWKEDVLLVIHPDTGVVEKEYGKNSTCAMRCSEKGFACTFLLKSTRACSDFSELYPAQERGLLGGNVFNGVSVSADPDLLYVTGKLWDRMFLIELLY
jgi:glutamine cyclotransferase